MRATGSAAPTTSRSAWRWTCESRRVARVSFGTALAYALLPPAGLALPGLVLLLLGRRWRWPAWVLLGSLAILSLRAVSSVLLEPLAVAAAPAPESAPQAIVIVGADHVSMGDPAWREPNPLTLERLRAGAALHRRSGLPILVAGGTSPDGSSQPEAMASSLRNDFQVPVRWEGAREQGRAGQAAAAAALLREAGLSRAYLVADYWEIRRDLDLFRRAGLQVAPAPVYPSRVVTPNAFDVVPLTSTWLDNAIALRQWAGLAADALAPSRLPAAREPGADAR